MHGPPRDVKFWNYGSPTARNASPGELRSLPIGSSITSNSITREGLLKITTKGQVTIPIDMRERLGLHPNTEVEFRIDGDRLIVEKAAGHHRGKTLVERMRGRGTIRMTTDQILALTRGD
jgi:AbrB family looped-hinge helix DNA binding protein